MFNAHDNYEQCMKDVGQSLESITAGAAAFKGSTGDTLRFECLKNYKAELKKHVPTVKSLYDGYVQNYSIKDGSLIQNSLKAENKAIEEIKGALKNAGPSGSKVANDVI